MASPNTNITKAIIDKMFNDSNATIEKLKKLLGVSSPQTVGYCKLAGSKTESTFNDACSALANMRIDLSHAGETAGIK